MAYHGTSQYTPKIEEHNTTRVWIGIAIGLVLVVAVLWIVYWYVKGQRQHRRQRQQQEIQRQQQEIHLVEVGAALPRTIYHAADEDDQLECSICLEEYQDEEELVEMPGCGHFFHPRCIQGAIRIRRECPICRGQLEG